MKNKFWSIIHNLIAHPLLITDFTIWFTDNYTYMDADMLINRRDAQDYFKGKKVKQYTREQVIKLYKPKKKGAKDA